MIGQALRNKSSVDRVRQSSMHWRMSSAVVLAAGALAAGLISAAAIAQSGYSPGPQNVNLPADYQSRFIRYATVDKPDRKIIRFLYINPEAFAAVNKSQPFASGTVLIMEDHAARLDAAGAPMRDQQGRMIPLPAVAGIFIQEKRTGWGVGYAETMRNGEWEYARFNPDGTRHSGPVTNCFDCHLKLRKDQDFTFNLWDYVQARP